MTAHSNNLTGLLSEPLHVLYIILHSKHDNHCLDFADISVQLEGDGFYLYLRCFLLMGPPELGGVPPRLDRLRGDPGEGSNPSEVDVFPSIASL